MIKHAAGRYGSFSGRIAIVAARFNQFITSRLLDGAVDALIRHGISSKQIDVVWVPGALEIPQVLQKLANRKRHAAFIALACVIRGETYHFECVAHEVTRGISQVALSSGVPITTAVLTVDSLEQAIDRAGLKAGNKGADAALAVLEMADLTRQFRTPS